MKLIIAGGRDLSVLPAQIHAKLYAQNVVVTQVVSGACGLADEADTRTAKGIDGCGEDWAKLLGLPVKRFPAKFKELGLKAGPIRNKQMAEYADALLLIWDGESRGSTSMKREMEKLGKPIYEVVLKVPGGIK